MCGFTRGLDIIEHYIFIFYKILCMCVTIELHTTFICKGVKNIEGIINDGWQLPTTYDKEVSSMIKKLTYIFKHTVRC